MKTIVSEKKVMRILSILLLVMMTGGITFCQNNQGNQGSGQKQENKSEAITPGQAATIKSILSKYDASKLTASDAKAIHEKFRAAGIHAGPETRDAIVAAGFDPDKLRALDPPPADNKGGGKGPKSTEERLKEVETNIVVPLSLSVAQTDAVMKAYRDFYTEVEKLRTSQGSSTGPVDRSKVEPLKVKRDDAIKKALPADKFTKYQELEKGSHQQKDGAGKNGQK